MGGVTVSDFLDMEVIWERFHGIGVILVEAHSAKKECMELRKYLEGHRGWRMCICILSRRETVWSTYLR